MITEIRMIGFSPDALAEAVRLFGQANHDRNFTQVREVYVEIGNPPRLIAEVCGDNTDATDSLEFTAAETAACLMLLCRRQQIPLPRNAVKSLRLIGGELCLVVARREITVQPAASEEPAGDDFVSPDGA
ncbi:MAG: hypothetical protein WCK65_03660 [Rhodospirillaceae bacterium]